MSSTSTTSKKQRVDDRYFDLVKRFPLRPIRSRQEHRDASEILDELLGRNELSPGQRDYVDALVHFVAEYERKAFRSKMRKLTPIEVLKHLMEANNMSTTDLGEVLGTRGLASEVLNGKRGLSKTLIVKLSRRFLVDPSLFLEKPEDTE
jgi:HTH-type transcriptional regulator/antitoxin HigA